MVSRVTTSVITVSVYRVARCGKQSDYLCYYCRCISGSMVWLVVCLCITVGVYQAAKCG